mmetsp:Transcript_18394/g.53165  ORF Transcript_18394/g.53165 Transcript_18394/m.53165 type:complete len:211 (+) Transcript_18394:549-1181(+)
MWTPGLSGSATSCAKACTKRFSSNMWLNNAQSSFWKSLNNGKPFPRSKTFATPKTSNVLKSASAASSVALSSASAASASSTSFSAAAMASSASAFRFSGSSSLASSASASPGFLGGVGGFFAAGLAAAAFAIATFATAARFFASRSATFFCRPALYSTCFCFHSLTTLLNWPRRWWNHADGFNSSTREWVFLSMTHCFKYSAAFAPLLHS